MPSLLGDAYASSDEDGKPVADQATPATGPTIIAAPEVSLEVWSPSRADTARTSTDC